MSTTRNHRRFALVQVTYANVEIANATIDQWVDAAGRTQWQARCLLKPGPIPPTGRLVGRTRDGQSLEGEVRVATDVDSPMLSRQTVVDFHGSGELRVSAPEPDTAP